METIKIKYFTDIEPVTPMCKGDWVDLRAAEDVTMKSGEFCLIRLGVGMILPEGFEAHLAPRSSTFAKFGIIAANSVGVIDNSFCGEEDEWKMPAYALRDTVIHKNDRICQFRIVEKQPDFELVTVEHLKEKSRGGFGSTGKD